MPQTLYTIFKYIIRRTARLLLLPFGENDKMDEKESKPLSAFLSDAEVKVVWREEERTKVGRGMITNDDENFVYLTGDKGTVIVNKRDIIAIKQ